MNGLDYFVGTSQKVRVREGNDKKFIIGIICLVLGIVGPVLSVVIGIVVKSVKVFEVCFVLSPISLVFGIIYTINNSPKNIEQKICMSDSEYDSFVENLISNRASNPKEYLGLDDMEIMEIEPIEFSGYVYRGSERIKKGNDELYRSNLYEKATIFFTKNEVHMYKAIINSISGKVTETTEVLFYEDIVSVSTENEIEKYGNVTIEYISFVLSSRGGKSFKVALLGTDNRQRSINAMRALIKEKKMK